MEQLLQLLPARPQPALVRYTSTAVLVGICFLALLGLQNRAGVLGFYLLFPAIFVSSILFDRGSGILATALSALLLYLRTKPAESVLPPGDIILSLIVFVIVALGLAIISGGLRTAWERATAAEHAKDLLLRELGHRTTNNLALVISVLSLQARSKTNPESRLVLEKAITRVEAIASAHDHFQPVAQNGRIEMRPYLEKLCSHLGDSLREVRPIAVAVDVEDVHLRTEQAVPLGLVVNELVTNAFKHGFPEERSGTVHVILKYSVAENTSSLLLTVEDDGVGCPAQKQERLGSRLTRLLAAQLGATLSWEDGQPGCRVRLQFSPDRTGDAPSAAQDPAGAAAVRAYAGSPARTHASAERTIRRE